MRSNSGKPLGIYVHIPFCKSKCEYCDFYSLGGSRDRRTTDQYLQALADHIRETGRLAPGLHGRHRLLRRRHAELLRRGESGKNSRRAAEALPLRRGPRDHARGQPRQRHAAGAQAAGSRGLQPHLHRAWQSDQDDCSSASAVRIPTSRRAWPSSARARRALPTSRST